MKSKNIDWEVHLATRTQRMKSSVIRELLKVTMQAGSHFLRWRAASSPNIFPVKEFQDACNKVLSENGPNALQYGPTEGFPPLKADICGQMVAVTAILVETRKCADHFRLAASAGI